MKNCALILLIYCSLSLAACSGGNSEPSIENGQMDDTTDTTDTILSPIDLQIPEFNGELIFTSEQRFDLTSFIQNVGLDRATNFVVSRDGRLVNADLIDNTLRSVTSIMQLDTNTLTASLIATDLGINTRLLFDAENTPVAVYAVGCQAATYTPNFNESILDLSSTLPEGRCLADDVEISANGNVLLFDSYEQGAGPNERVNESKQAYTLDTAALTDYPDITLTIGDDILKPFDTVPFGYERILSDNGEHFFVKQWWSTTNADGEVIRQVGAVLWNTVSAEWQVRGQAADLRNCTVTQKNPCTPPYFYAMSNDGSTQYFSYPSTELLDNGNAPIRFKSYVDSAETGSPTSTNISGTGSVRSLTANSNGDLLLVSLGDDSTREEPGYALYQASSDKLISLNRALKGCALQDSMGDQIDESNCQYTSKPYSTTGDPIAFTADGKHTLIRSISRFTDERIQSVDDFFLDVENAAMYTLPALYTANPNFVSSDATVMLGSSGFPDYEILIGKR